MTITVTIDIQDGGQGQTWSVVANHPAEEAIRFTFNPSGLSNVTKLKALAAAFLTACDEVLADQAFRSQTQSPSVEAPRELAVAKTHMQTASMWAVLGATKGL